MTRKLLMLQYFLKEIERLDFEISQILARVRFRKTDMNDSIELAMLYQELEVTKRIYSHMKVIFDVLSDNEKIYADLIDKRL